MRRQRFPGPTALLSQVHKYFRKFKGNHSAQKNGTISSRYRTIFATDKAFASVGGLAMARPLESGSGAPVTAAGAALGPIPVQGADRQCGRDNHQGQHRQGACVGE